MKRRLALALVLIAGVLGAYARVGAFEFVAYDDDTYVYDNPEVARGLDAASVRWAFTTGHASNWHPVTWLSHLLDVSLFGLDPGGHHWTSVALHALNAALLFLLLARATGRAGPAFASAALFAWHPLRAESVAWVSERKDVLSGTFFLLTLLAYVAWVRSGDERPSGRPSEPIGVATGGRRPLLYSLMLLALALGLMSKPMLVTVPAILLLLDVWPLGARGAPAHSTRATSIEWRSKLLPVLLVVLSSVVTLLVQRAGGAVVRVAGLTPLLRIENALASVGVYVRQLVWPSGLACFYPHARATSDAPEATLAPAAAIGALVLVALVVVALRARRRWPYVFVGIAWFLVMLVPVIGLVQVGTQAHADRYTYLPSIGPSFALAFLGADVLARRPALRAPLLGALAATLAALLAATWRQVGTWRDSTALFEHALRVTEDNHIAHANLGWVLYHEGRLEEAYEHLSASVAILPADRAALLNLGIVQTELGRYDEASATLQRYVAAEPRDWNGFARLGELLFRTADDAGAAVALERAIALGAPYGEHRLQLGLVLLNLGRLEPAEARLREASAMSPESPEPHFGLGMLALARDDAASAAAAFERTLELGPEHADALLELAWLLATSDAPDVRDPRRALELASRHVALVGESSRALEARAAAHAALGELAEAVRLQTRALALPNPERGARKRLELYRAAASEGRDG